MRHAHASGLAVTLRLEGARDELRAEAAHLGYRVVQEGITNALRYAAGAPVHVHVRIGGEDARFEVVNGPASETAGLRGTGNGLRGLRERLGEHGGTLEAGPRPTAAGGSPRGCRHAGSAAPCAATPVACPAAEREPALGNKVGLGWMRARVRVAIAAATATAPA